MLRVLEKARSKCPIEISSTFCGAHSVPKGSTAAEVPLSSESTMSLSQPGNQRCDRETAAGSFEAQGGRSPLTIFGNLADCPFYHRSNECGEYWRVLWKRRLWNPGFSKHPRGSWYMFWYLRLILCVCVIYEGCALCRFFLSQNFQSFPREGRVEPPFFQAGKAAGFRVNFHGDELNPLGGAEMGAAIQAEAISHLEEVAILMLSASWKMYQAFTMFYQSLKYVKILDNFQFLR